MEDFTAGATHNQPAHRQSSIDPNFDARVRQLVADWGAGKSPELIEEMIITALKMARDGMGTGDLKLMNRSFKEMRYAAKVFAGYRQFRKVCVFGSARTPPSEAQYEVAEEFAREMVAQNYMVITGAGDGIMGAAQRGAGREHSFGLNIRLPFEQHPNAIIEGDAKLINFNYFFTRKLNFVKETHAFALFPGGFGTMDEAFEALTLMQTGKARVIPVVLLDRPDGTYWQTWMKFLTEHLFEFGYVDSDDFHLFKIVPNVAAAVQEIVHFYSVYQSSRWVGEQLAIRLSRKISDQAVAALNQEFRDIVRTGEIVQGSALRQEKNEPEIWDLPRLVLTPHRRSFGRFRQLIDAINAAGIDATGPGA
ncbi:MAG: TIGR00730 family Rossman fold protein [Verrucomicrobia bacterium]|nr:MAG: TIGR00730 family Rossman fold protein [Verrucomicrobiota bacterium]